MYGQLVAKVNAVDTSELVEKLTTTQKLIKLKRKYLIILKYTTISEFNKLTKEKFDHR